MKRLVIAGLEGVLLSSSIVDVEGDNFNINFTIPMFLPVVNVSLVELDEKETKHIKAIIKNVRGIADKDA